MKLTGSKILIECLKEQGVDTIFGFPGGAVLNIYDELYRSQNEIRHILTSHEQGAAHAADGYARATERMLLHEIFRARMVSGLEPNHLIRFCLWGPGLN